MPLTFEHRCSVVKLKDKGWSGGGGGQCQGRVVSKVRLFLLFPVYFSFRSETETPVNSGGRSLFLKREDFPRWPVSPAHRPAGGEGPRQTAGGLRGPGAHGSQSRWKLVPEEKSGQEGSGRSRGRERGAGTVHGGGRAGVCGLCEQVGWICQPSPIGGVWAKR